MPTPKAPKLSDTKVKSEWLKTADAAKLLPGDPAPDICTVNRWMKKGVSVNGQTVRLRHVVTGNIYTRREWVDEFIAAITVG